jgi:hypothetical protein
MFERIVRKVIAFEHVLKLEPPHPKRHIRGISAHANKIRQYRFLLWPFQL